MICKLIYGEKQKLKKSELPQCIKEHLSKFYNKHHSRNIIAKKIWKGRDLDDDERLDFSDSSYGDGDELHKD